MTQLTSALSLAVAGNSGTESAADLTSLSQQLSGIRDQVVSLANTSYQGTYIFAGSQGNVQPFTVDTSTSPATTTYNGDAQVGTVTTTNGQQIQTRLAGSAVFSASGADVMSALNSLIADFANGTVSATAGTDIGVVVSGARQRVAAAGNPGQLAQPPRKRQHVRSDGCDQPHRCCDRAGSGRSGDCRNAT